MRCTRCGRVAQEADKAALVKLDQFLGQPDLVQMFVVEPLLDKDIPGNANDMFLDEDVISDEIVHPVRGEQVLQLQSVDPGGV